MLAGDGAHCVFIVENDAEAERHDFGLQLWVPREGDFSQNDLANPQRGIVVELELFARGGAQAGRDNCGRVEFGD